MIWESGTSVDAVDLNPITYGPSQKRYVGIFI